MNNSLFGISPQLESSDRRYRQLVSDWWGRTNGESVARRRSVRITTALIRQQPTEQTLGPSPDQVIRLGPYTVRWDAAQQVYVTQPTNALVSLLLTLSHQNVLSKTTADELLTTYIRQHQNPLTPHRLLQLRQMADDQGVTLPDWCWNIQFQPTPVDMPPTAAATGRHGLLREYF